MRPDELAAQKDIERSSNWDKGIKGVAKTAAAAGMGVAGSRLLPLLGEFVPMELAMKGINKIAPKVGDFLQRGQKAGLDLRDGFDFIKNQIEKSSERKEERESKSNPFQNFENEFPRLSEALNKIVEQGQPAEAAAAILKNASWAKSDINKLEKNVGKNFVDFVKEMFGSPQNQTVRQPQQMSSQVMQEIGMNPMSSNQMMGQEAGAGGNQMLAQLFDKIMSM